ncbi:MAG TPA: MATE family efflux transporter, partial [Lachnospiraceae bacterium]|nr:MATE family efflux transporter [Lachnospiraceae bacterium]
MSVHVQDMTAGKPTGLIVRFALPLMLGSIFQQLYTVVDTIVVGKLIGVEALASLGAADWPYMLVLGLVIGLTQGFSIKISQCYGAEDYE